MVLVILDEHRRNHAANARTQALHPKAHIVFIPEAASGDAKTARPGINALPSESPAAIFNRSGDRFWMPS